MTSSAATLALSLRVAGYVCVGGGEGRAQCRAARGEGVRGPVGIRGVSPATLQLSSGRIGLKTQSDFASWKALGCSRASQAFFKPETWEGLRERGRQAGGRERGLEEGSAPEREGQRERRGAGAAEPIPRIHYCKHLPGVSGGVRVGAAAPTLAGPRRIEAAVRPEQPRDPRPAGAALGEPLSRPAQRPAPGPAPGTRASEARPPGSPAALRGPPSPWSPGAAGPSSPAFPARPPAFRTRGLGGGGEA